MKYTNDDFMNAMLKLNEIEVLGLAKLMGVPLVNEEKEPIAAEEILSNMIMTYGSYNRQRKRMIMKVITGKIKR